MHPSYSENPSSVNPLEEGINHSTLPSHQSTPLPRDKSRPQKIDPKDPAGQNPNNMPCTVVNGIDFLKVSFWLEWETLSVLEELESLKNAVQSTEEPTIQFRIVENCTWNLHRSGTLKFNYRLTSGDVTLLLNNRKANGSIPTARLEIGSLSCWSPGYLYYYERVKRLLQFLGATLIREEVSEVHLAVDFLNVDIKNLGIDIEDKWVSRAQQFNTHRERRKFTGISMGKNEIMLRIYDKVYELKARRNTNKRELFADIWGYFIYCQSPVTRVEFQLRRPVLKEFENKLQTVKDLLFALDSVWQYCTGSWARFCKKVIDRNHNQSKSENDDFWNQVNRVSWSGISTLERRKIYQNKSFDHVKTMSRGLAMSLAAFHEAQPDDIDHIVGYSTQLIQTELIRFFTEDQHTFTERMKRKRNEIFTNV